MDILDIITIIGQVITFIGVIFIVYNYFKNPQIKSEKTDALLSQQMNWNKEANEKRFLEMSNKLTEAMTLAENHTHTVDVKVDKLVESVNLMNLNLSKEVATLSTIINERIPHK